MLQYGFSKAARLSRAGQLAEAAEEYAKLAAAADKPHLSALAFVLQAEMLLRDPPTVLDTQAARERPRTGSRARRTRARMDLHARHAGAAGRPPRPRRGTCYGARSRKATSRKKLRPTSPSPKPAPESRRSDGNGWSSPANTGRRGAHPKPRSRCGIPATPSRALRAAIAEHPEEYWLRLALARELTTAGRHDELVETNREMAADRELPERFRADRCPRRGSHAAAACG